MTAATTCSVSLPTPNAADARFDILRGVGLAVSLTIILVLPLAMSLIAALKG